MCITELTASPTLTLRNNWKHFSSYASGEILEMRILVFIVGILSLGSLVSAAYSTKNVENYVAYAHTVSRAYASGDFNDPSGWRECVVDDGGPGDIGIVCEGTRSIVYQIGKRIEVNYYCEFRFTKLDSFKYRVESEICQ
jgi:hypothetical protein